MLQQKKSDHKNEIMAATRETELTLQINLAKNVQFFPVW
jgi:hypothetical protein